MQQNTTIGTEPVTREAVTRTKYVAGLALLRGLAALSVGLYHFTGGALPKLQVPQVQELFKNGWLGVEVFFVISGFVIPYSLLGKNYSINKFLSYMTKRIVRINPPAYIALLLVVAQWYFIDYFIAHDAKYTKDLTAVRLLHNIFFTIPLTQYKWVIGIFWTLAIEFQFYIIIGILFNYLFEKKYFILFVVVFISFNFFNHIPGWSGDNFFHFSSLFALGGLTLYRRQGIINNPVYLAALAVFTLAAYLEIGPYQALAGILTSLAIQYVAIDNPVTRFFGNISYSFYLVHVFVGNTFEFILVRFISPESVINKIGMTLICLGAAIAVAYVFYLLIEKPFMRLANRLRV